MKISHLKDNYKKLIIGVDRRSDFSNKEIFHRLIKREDAKTVFEDPTS